MVFLGWISLVVLSLWISVIAFVWAARSGQFSDQARARYLALNEDLSTTETVPSSRGRVEPYALLFIILAGVGVMTVLVFLSLSRLGGTG